MVFFSDASGRSFTNYSPRCDTDEEIKKKIGVTDNYSYKLYIQRYGDKILDEERKRSLDTRIFFKM